MGLAEILIRTFEEKLFPKLSPREPPLETWPAVVLRYGTPTRELRLYVPEPEVTASIVNLLRSRREWMAVSSAVDLIQRRCTATLAYLGLLNDQLESIAQAGTLQITIAPEMLTARQFPWEYVLAEATRPLRFFSPGQKLGKAFLIARHLSGVARVDKVPSKLLVVESAPGRIGRMYELESERRAVASSLDLGNVLPLANPDLDELIGQVTSYQPDIIHLAGVDSQQGAAILGTNQTQVPGMYLHTHDEPTVVPFKNLATALLVGAVKPQLVSFNMYNSSDGAAEVVAGGAQAAIGFQDEVDDEVAESFFGAFYGAWKQSDFQDLGEAYRSAWLALGAYAEKVRGTGIVLWTAVPLIEDAPRTRRPKRTATPERIVRADALAADDDPYSHFRIQYTPPSQLNYSMLHNNANIVPLFTIQRQKPGVHKGLTVEVRLSAGVEEAVYKETFTLDDKNVTAHVHERIRVPLTAGLSRSLDEGMFSTVYASVRWGEHVLQEQTDRVQFLPIDEWRYDTLNCRWLPSFVFPRDPVVRQIVDAAQRYLVALRDDSTAGFDGYQSYEPNGSSMEERCRAIDAQVQALWWAVVHDYSLAYINPPPSFRDDAQRLRTPSEVIEGRRGTCIDLTLLLAACLEYVEIYPVIFLLNDHAFPGYWRSERSYLELSAVMTKTPIAPAEALADAAWMLGKNRFADVVGLVQQGHIVPLESVLLTSRSGFWPAVEEGLQDLRSKRHFDSMFDVKTARKSVTPLPIWSKRL
jgi:hypothetical protein